MKITHLISAYVLVACLCLQVNGNCRIDGEYLPVGSHDRNCIVYNCRQDGSFRAVGCAEMRCRPGKLHTWKPMDPSKPYPFCCPHPICYP